MNNMVGSAAEMTAVKAADGDMILKGKIQEMTNPNTAAQQAVRSPFAYFSQLGSLLLPHLNLFFEKPGPMQSPYNGFVAKSVKEQLQTGPSDADDEEMSRNGVYTDGHLYNPDIKVPDPSAVTNINGGTPTIFINWNYDAGSAIQNAFDQLWFLELNWKTSDWRNANIGEIRAGQQTTFAPVVPADGGNLYVFYFVGQNTDKTHLAQPLFQVNADTSVQYAQESWA